MPNYSFFNKNESNSDNAKRMGNISNFETIVVINCILNVPLMLTSITGNALVLVAILRTPSLRSVPSTIFLCSLASTDFLVGLVGQPFYIASELYHSTDVPLSKVETLISVSLCGVSLATMTAISVDRFLALHYHVTYANLMTTKRAMTTSASLWFVSILLSCLRVWIRGVFFLITGVFIAVSFVISCASYIKIYFIVRHHQIQIHAQQQAVNSFNIPDSNDMILSKKSAVKTFIYYICMIVCYLPYLSYILLSTTSVKAFGRNWSFVYTVVFLNSSVNPFLYCWCNREIRSSVVKIVRKMMCRQTGEASQLERGQNCICKERNIILTDLYHAINTSLNYYLNFTEKNGLTFTNSSVHLTGFRPETQNFVTAKTCMYVERDTALYIICQNLITQRSLQSVYIAIDFFLVYAVESSLSAEIQKILFLWLKFRKGKF